MKPVTQTRTGDRGNCFASCLASIFETPLPEFGLTSDEGYDANVDKWLAKRGWQYSQTEDTSTPPIGHHTIEGISPRGGMHATVGLNGKMVWDPHPEDGTGHGLVKVVRYGLLTPLGAKDSVTLRPDRDDEYALQYDAAPKKFADKVERLYEKHDDIDWNDHRRAWMGPPHTYGGASESDAIMAYSATHNDIVKLLQDAAALLEKSNILNKQHWRSRVTAVKQNIKVAETEARKGQYRNAMVTQESALMVAHQLLDALRNATANASKAKDAEPITTSKFIPGVGFHGGKVSAKSGKVVVKLDGKKIGEAGVKYEGGAWRITTLAVEPSLVGKGYGKYLYAELIRTAAENGVKELRSCSETNRSPGSEHAWNRLAETHGAVKESGTWRVKAKDADKVAYVIYRPPGSNAGVVEIDGKKYYIDATHRLVDAGYRLDVSKRKTTNSFGTKSSGEVDKWVHSFPAHSLSRDASVLPIPLRKGRT